MRIVSSGKMGNTCTFFSIQWRDANAPIPCQSHHPQRGRGEVTLFGLGPTPAETNLANKVAHLEKLLSQTEKERVAAWMIEHSYPTGHGDTLNDLLLELIGHVSVREREACATVAEESEAAEYAPRDRYWNQACSSIAAAIRARSALSAGGVR
jgi:hypothetical protein